MPNRDRYLNRELSWLAFNNRVLQEASDQTVPLLERLKFLAIYASNLDEYFRVRVATVKRLKNLKKKTRAKLKDDPAWTHDAILKEVDRQQSEFGQIFREQILPGLESHNVHLVDEKKLTQAQAEFVQHYFEEQVQPQLLPIVIDQESPRLFLKDGTVYLGITLYGPAHENPAQPVQFVILELPVSRLGRFLRLPDEGDHRYVMFLDDVIRYCLPQLFPGHSLIKANAIKLSRDAELDLDDVASGSLLEKIRKSLRKRMTGHPARFLYDPHIPQVTLDLIQHLTGTTYDELVAGGRYHSFRDLFKFPDLHMPELQYDKRHALPHPVLEKVPSIMEVMNRQDVLVHYPYQKYDYVLQLFKEAAADPDVTAIYITLYRVAEMSAVGKALVKAAKAGKQVTAVVELQARFDEESNIKWARKLEKAGANVIHGAEGYKVHTKLALISRQENGRPKLYSYLSTGNFNEVTSHIYADHGLFTTDPRLTKEVQEVFDFFVDQQISTRKFKNMLVAPFNMRKRFLELIDREIEAAKHGLPAYMILKMNALEDEKMVDKLYEASKAGVQIKLLVRGICVLKPGVPGLSENIEVRSLIDRYLEHARVYIFANGGHEKLYIASADWMTRNLTRRIEVAFPIYDPSLAAQIRQIIELQLQDNQKSRDSENNYLRMEGGPLIRAQYATFDLLAPLRKAKPELLGLK